MELVGWLVGCLSEYAMMKVFNREIWSIQYYTESIGRIFLSFSIMQNRLVGYSFSSVLCRIDW